MQLDLTNTLLFLSFLTNSTVCSKGASFDKEGHFSCLPFFPQSEVSPILWDSSLWTQNVGLVSLVPVSVALQFLHVVLWILNRNVALIFYMHRIQTECPELSSFCHNLKSGTMALVTEESPPTPKCPLKGHNY